MNTLEENRRVEPCKVDKSNGIEIQINAAFNDAYRISRLWKGRKREGKDPIMSRGGRVSERTKKRRWTTFAEFDSIDSTLCYQSPWNLSTDTNPILIRFCCGISSTLETIRKFGPLNCYERCQRLHNFHFK